MCIRDRHVIIKISLIVQNPSHQHIQDELLGAAVLIDDRVVGKPSQGGTLHAEDGYAGGKDFAQ